MGRPKDPDNLRDAASHFRFGRNWRNYARRIDETRISRGQENLLRLFRREDLTGRSFLDIGSGSGLHSVAALRLGCERVLACDIDPDSVVTTRETLLAHARTDRWTCRQMSVFDMSPATIGRFDVVYSWGVLHHTGAMWEAIRKAADLVAPDGLFAIAIYVKTPLCGFWRIEKRLYARSPRFLQVPLRVMFVAGGAVRNAVEGRNPFSNLWRYDDQSTARGMSRWNDVHDWLGGYPYESATAEEVVAFVTGLGFEVVRTLGTKPNIGVFGSGCGQYVFRRRSATAQSAGEKA